MANSAATQSLGQVPTPPTFPALNPTVSELLFPSKGRWRRNWWGDHVWRYRGCPGNGGVLGVLTQRWSEEHGVQGFELQLLPVTPVRHLQEGSRHGGVGDGQPAGEREWSQRKP